MPIHETATGGVLWEDYKKGSSGFTHNTWYMDHVTSLNVILLIKMEYSR